uniref:Uncharacterized protein n=1 Tax=Solanum tuberosum TaxID=4113 RepID=M1D845_SOLTU
MARTPPVSLFRPPDQSHLRRSEETNKTHQAASSNSSYNSTKSRNTEAMNSAISERELEGIQKIISPDQDKQIQRKLFIGNESPNRGLQHTQKSHDSIEPNCEIWRGEFWRNRRKLAGAAPSNSSNFPPLSRRIDHWGLFTR